MTAVFAQKNILLPLKMNDTIKGKQDIKKIKNLPRKKQGRKKKDWSSNFCINVAEFKVLDDSILRKRCPAFFAKSPSISLRRINSRSANTQNENVIEGSYMNGQGSKYISRKSPLNIQSYSFIDPLRETLIGQNHQVWEAKVKKSHSSSNAIDSTDSKCKVNMSSNIVTELDVTKLKLTFKNLINHRSTATSGDDKLSREQPGGKMPHSPTQRVLACQENLKITNTNLKFEKDVKKTCFSVSKRGHSIDENSKELLESNLEAEVTRGADDKCDIPEINNDVSTVNESTYLALGGSENKVQDQTCINVNCDLPILAEVATNRDLHTILSGQPPPVLSLENTCDKPKPIPYSTNKNSTVNISCAIANNQCELEAVDGSEIITKETTACTALKVYDFDESETENALNDKIQLNEKLDATQSEPTGQGETHKHLDDRVASDASSSKEILTNLNEQLRNDKSNEQNIGYREKNQDTIYDTSFEEPSPPLKKCPTLKVKNKVCIKGEPDEIAHRHLHLHDGYDSDATMIYDDEEENKCLNRKTTDLNLLKIKQTQQLLRLKSKIVQSTIEPNEVDKSPKTMECIESLYPSFRGENLDKSEDIPNTPCEVVESTQSTTDSGDVSDVNETKAECSEEKQCKNKTIENVKPVNTLRVVLKPNKTKPKSSKHKHKRENQNPVGIKLSASKWEQAITSADSVIYTDLTISRSIKKKQKNHSSSKKKIPHGNAAQQTPKKIKNEIRKKRNSQDMILKNINKIFPKPRRKRSKDEDDLPTILPPKRRRQGKSNVTSDPKSDMDRINHEFPQFNWLEKKYKDRDAVDGDVFESNDCETGRNDAYIQKENNNTEAGFGQETNAECLIQTVNDNANVNSPPKVTTSSNNRADGVTLQNLMVHNMAFGPTNDNDSNQSGELNLVIAEDLDNNATLSSVPNLEDHRKSSMHLHSINVLQNDLAPIFVATSIADNDIVMLNGSGQSTVQSGDLGGILVDMCKNPSNEVAHQLRDCVENDISFAKTNEELCGTTATETIEKVSEVISTISNTITYSNTSSINAQTNAISSFNINTSIPQNTSLNFTSSVQNTLPSSSVTISEDISNRTTPSCSAANETLNTSNNISSISLEIDKTSKDFEPVAKKTKVDEIRKPNDIRNIPPLIPVSKPKRPQASKCKLFDPEIEATYNDIKQLKRELEIRNREAGQMMEILKQKEELLRSMLLSSSLGPIKHQSSTSGINLTNNTLSSNSVQQQPPSMSNSSRNNMFLSTIPKVDSIKIPPPAHLCKKENTKDILKTLDANPIVMPPGIKATCPFISRQRPLSPPSRFKTDALHGPLPAAHAQKPFEMPVKPLGTKPERSISQGAESKDQIDLNTTRALSAPAQSQQLGSPINLQQQRRNVTIGSPCHSVPNPQTGNLQLLKASSNLLIPISSANSNVPSQLQNVNVQQVIPQVITHTNLSLPQGGTGGNSTESAIQQELNEAVKRRQKQEQRIEQQDYQQFKIAKPQSAPNNVPKPKPFSNSFIDNIPDINKNVATAVSADIPHSTFASRPSLHTQTKSGPQSSYSGEILSALQRTTQHSVVNGRANNLTSTMSNRIQTQLPHSVRLIGAATVPSNNITRTEPNRNFQHPNGVYAIQHLQHPLTTPVTVSGVGPQLIQMHQMQRQLPPGTIQMYHHRPQKEASKPYTTPVPLTMQQNMQINPQSSASAVPHQMTSPPMINQTPIATSRVHQLVQGHLTSPQTAPLSETCAPVKMNTQMQELTSARSVPHQVNIMPQPEVSTKAQHIFGSCIICGKFSLYLCSTCQSIWYCSQQCQLKHWTTHQHECKFTAK